MNRRKQGVLVVLTVFMSCLLVAYLAVITTHHNGLTLFARDHESWHSGDNDSWSGSGTQSELYPTPVFNPTCQALEQLAATSGTCTTSDQCTGLNCVVIGIGSVDFRIEPCHNPPAVHVVGKDASGIVIVNETLTKSRQESFGLGTLNINIMQSPNEDSISISVTASVVAGIAPVTIIPETTIPLNRAQCPHAVTPTQPTTTHTFTPLRMPSPTPRVSETCDSLQQLASSSQLCITNVQCSGLHCELPGGVTGSFDVTVEPCHNPPAVNVVQRNALGEVIYNETLTKSRKENFGLGTLNINLMQSPNEDSISINVTVSVVAGTAPVTIIPETTIPLNRAQCPHAVTPTTTRTFTPLRMPSPTPRVSETCDSLQQLASSSQLCVTNVQCSGLHCELPGGVTGSFDVTVEPCHNPPAVNVVQRNALGEVIYNETLTKSRKENFGLGTLNINLMQSPNEDSISINVTVSVVAGTAPVTIIPETTIPLNRAQCPHAVTPTTTRTFTPLRMPSPTPRVSETCDSLQQLASSSQLCVTNVQCSGLHCELPGGVTGSFDVTVEPCHNPPAVNVVQRNALGEVIYNETLTKSRKENFGLGTLNINLMQSPNEDSISINVTVSVVAGTAPVTIIPETTIPLNRAQCPRAVTPTQPTTTRTFTPLRMPSPTPRASETCESLQQLASSSQSSSRPPMGTFYTAVIVTTTRNTSTMVSPSKLPSGSSQSITIAVAVPVTILLVSIGGIVMLVAIVMAIRRHKRVRREYHFQRMTFNTDNDDDDDDNDL